MYIDKLLLSSIWYLFIIYCSYRYVLIVVYKSYLGSAMPEVRGTAEPHGGAYPP